MHIDTLELILTECKNPIIQNAVAIELLDYNRSIAGSLLIKTLRTTACYPNVGTLVYVLNELHISIPDDVARRIKFEGSLEANQELNLSYC
jgi:hypothetical protein